TCTICACATGRATQSRAIDHWHTGRRITLHLPFRVLQYANHRMRAWRHPSSLALIPHPIAWRRFEMLRSRFVWLAALSVASSAPVSAQQDPSLFNGLRYRMVGPNRGGRSTAVTGVPGQPYTYYMGIASGGVWKTTDA